MYSELKASELSSFELFVISNVRSGTYGTYSTKCFLFLVFCYFLLFISYNFAFYPVFCFMSPEIKVNEQKKQEICSKKYNC